MLRTPPPSSGRVAMAMRRSFVLVLLFSLAAGPATAIALTARSSDVVYVAGEVGVTLLDGRLRWDAVPGNGSIEVFLPRATLHFWSQELYVVDPVKDPVFSNEFSTEHRETEPRDEAVTVENATLRIVFEDEPAHVVAYAVNGTALRLGGFVDGSGRAARFGPGGYAAARNVSLPEPVEAAVPPPLPALRWSCEEGWAVQGITPVLEGFPLRGGEATAALSGDFRLDVAFGDVTIEDARGTVRRHLGREPLDATPGAHRERNTILRLDATGVLGATFDRAWAACAPAQAWTVDGTAVWTHASGRVQGEGAPRDFEDATVLALGTLALDVDASAASLASPTSYAASGDAEVRVNGVLVAARARPAVEPATAFTLAALAAALVPLLLKAALAVYTRLHREDVLKHPRRKALYDVVAARPGIHLRELHRAVGGAWGPFAFHLRVLGTTGYVRTVGARGVSRVFPVGVDLPDATLRIAHPVPRAIYAALPADGSRVRAVDVRRALGISPQLLRHHLRVLAEERLVVVEGPALGVKTLRRG